MNIIKFWTKRSPIQIGIIAGVKEAVYIYLISQLMLYISTRIQPSDTQGMILGLTLLVISAAISGAIVFGFPIYFALQKEYTKAVTTFTATIITLAVIFAVTAFLV